MNFLTVYPSYWALFFANYQLQELVPGWEQQLRTLVSTLKQLQTRALNKEQWRYEEKKWKKIQRHQKMILRIVENTLQYKKFFFKIKLITNFVKKKSNIIKIKTRKYLPLAAKSDTLKILSTAPVIADLVKVFQLLHADDCKTKKWLFLSIPDKKNCAICSAFMYCSTSTCVKRM